MGTMAGSGTDLTPGEEPVLTFIQSLTVFALGTEGNVELF